jgi:hypothetical protein
VCLISLSDTTTCNNNTGVLPPISQDCQTIANAIQIFQGTQNDTFTVAPNHLETLTFGTCSLFFENLSSGSMAYRFSSLVGIGSAFSHVHTSDFLAYRVVRKP